MRKRRKKEYSVGRILLVLFLISLTFWLLPRSWTSPLISLVQFLVPFQDATSVTSNTVSDALTGQGNSSSGDSHRTLELQRTACENQAAALSAHIEELEREVARLSAARSWQADATALGARGRLIPARVLAEDLLPWRDSRLVTAGSVHGAQHGAAVASAWFTLDQGETDGARSGLAILLSETFVGWVDQVGTHTCRVKMVSDVGVEIKVRLGRFTDQGFHSLERYYWLVGRGRGLMELRDVERRDIESGLVQMGDSVLSDPESDALPTSLIIGTLARIDSDRDNPLLSIATIQTGLDPSRLRKVYIYDPN